jgi:hypothetical protein
MTDPHQTISVDDAVSAFIASLKQRLGTEGDGPCGSETPEEAEDRRFRFAEDVLRAACPDPRFCTHHRCKRTRLCRHFADLRAVRDGTRKLPPSRRPPGATMLRHAMWVFVNSLPR